MITKEELTAGIRRDLNLEDAETDINESYAAVPKKYDLNTELLSTKAKHAHKEIYQNHIEKLNRVSAEQDGVNRQEDFARYHDLKKREIFELNAVYLHELFFANISDVHSEITMDTLTFMRLERDFGNFDSWQYDFVANAMSSTSGWAVCAYSTFLQRYINFFVDGNDGCIPVGCYPVIAIDVWEHVYFRDYLDDKKSYVYAMMKELQWDVIEERFKRAEKIAGAMR